LAQEKQFDRFALARTAWVIVHSGMHLFNLWKSTGKNPWSPQVTCEIVCAIKRRVMKKKNTWNFLGVDEVVVVFLVSKWCARRSAQREIWWPKMFECEL
jgi:hypothetical protein